MNNPFTHLYLETRSGEDAVKVAREVSTLVSDFLPTSLDQETLQRGISFLYRTSVNENVNLRYDPRESQLHIEVDGGSDFTTRRASSIVFETIVEYVRKARKQGTYEIQFEVGLGEALERLVLRSGEVLKSLF